MTNKEIEDFTVLKEHVDLDEYIKSDMKDLKDYVQESLEVDEGLQIETGKAIKDMFKHADVREVVIIRFIDDKRAEELEQGKVYGPVATKDGKLYGIKE